MTKGRFLPIAILTALSISAFAQSAPPPKAADSNKTQSSLPSVMAGIGVLYFNGTIDKGSNITAYSTIRGGYTLGVEWRPVSFLGLQLDGMLGKLSSSERSNDTADNKNFQDNVWQAELTANLHLDGLILKKDAPIAPFLYTGFSYMSYTEYTDLYDAAGAKYYYWTDGSIRNVPQNAYDVSTANASNNYHVVNRSYNYNTKVGSGSTECVPVGLGVKVKVTDNLAINVQAAYYFTFSKSLDALATSVAAKNDKYLFSFATLEWHFTKTAEGHIDESKYPAVIDNTFIIDTVKKDAGPSAADLEKLKRNDSLHAGDTMSLSHEEAQRESEGFNKNHSKRYLDSIANVQNGGGKGHPTVVHDPNKVPPRFRPADYNHDGYISPDEITRAIDEFFDGTSTMTIADINGLIDYFFDQ